MTAQRPTSQAALTEIRKTLAAHEKILRGGNGLSTGIVGELEKMRLEFKAQNQATNARIDNLAEKVESIAAPLRRAAWIVATALLLAALSVIGAAAVVMVNGAG